MLIHTNSFSWQLFHLQRLHLTETNQYILLHGHSKTNLESDLIWNIFTDIRKGFAKNIQIAW